MGTGPKKFKTREEADTSTTAESRFWRLTDQHVVLGSSKSSGSPKFESEEHEPDKSDPI